MATEAILELEGIVAGYGKMTILNETSFAIRGGAITTIIGPNGAGKSTVFKAIFGLVSVRAGRIAFEGEEITNLKPRELLERGICYVPQGRNIFPELSVRHNLELGATALRARGEVRGRMEAAMDRFPMRRIQADAQASTLSGGEQKLLDVAMAFMSGPRLVLLDEPAGGVNLTMLATLRERLRDINREQRATFVVIEHNMDFVMSLCSRIIVLAQGRVISEGEPEAVRADPQVIEAYLGH